MHITALGHEKDIYRRNRRREYVELRNFYYYINMKLADQLSVRLSRDSGVSLPGGKPLLSRF